MRIPPERFVFDFESVWEANEELWAMGVQIPVHGEEIIRLKVADSMKNRTGVVGTFYQRLLHEFQKGKDGKEKRKLLRGFIRSIGKVLKMVHSDANSKNSDFYCEEVGKGGSLQRRNGKCWRKGDDKVIFYWKTSSDAIEYSSRPAKGYRFRLKLFDPAGHYFKKIKVIVGKNGQSSASNIQLDLMLSECTTIKQGG